MKLLALETSTLVGSVAAVDGERLLCEVTLQVSETHSSQIMPVIEYVLKTVRLEVGQLDALGVALGPGSFTGLRIGMATIKGLAVTASKPVVGVSTLEAMAWEFPYCPYLICPLIDARMKEVYGAFFRSIDGELIRQSQDTVGPVTELVRDVREPALFFGSGAMNYRGKIEELMGPLARFAGPDLEGARASLVGFLAHRRLVRGDVDDLDTLEPLYIRESLALAKTRRGHS
ncbi:MAG: tRNA (adenosine(37)-N6)-threonylcarbamoyltransferase complex dimerization subunit type 1 TsaB [Candidatus Abyssubacteria bacterium]